MVVVVKLERPQGKYYGGAVAAPVTRAAVEAVLASRASHIDRAALVTVAARPSAPAEDGIAVGVSDEVGVLGPTAFGGPQGTPWSTVPVEAPTARFASSYGPGWGSPASRNAGRELVPSGADSQLLRLAGGNRRSTESGPAPGMSLVPEVVGLASRDAARRMHSAGLRVVLSGRGRVVATDPPPGAGVAKGDTVRLVAGGQ